jgi:glucosyl-3-phosphoglycerate synthase
MKVVNWFEKNRFSYKHFSDIKKLVELKKRHKVTISLGIPTLNEEATIGKIVSVMKTELMDKHHLLDEIAIIDSGSTDKTREVARAAGAKTFASGKALKEERAFYGKGENLWKSLYLLKGDIIVWIDADIKNIHPRFVYGLVGPLLVYPEIGFSKAFYDRPIKVKDIIQPIGGGRVTELTIRPLFNMFFPRLSGFIQPLSGEYAGRREVLEKVPFFTGYGVETGLLIDICTRFGLKKMAQVDLLRRIHRNQSLYSLTKMAYGILRVFSQRASQFGKLIPVKKKLRNKMRIPRKKDGTYFLEEKRIVERERPPIVTLDKYRKKFKKEVIE